MLIPYFTIIRTKQVAVVEAMGKFSRVIGAGPKLILPWESVVGRLSLKVKEMQVSVETKTLDDVFVKLLIAVQYQVIPQRAKEAFYELSDPLQQIESYIFDEVRSTVPNMNLDDVFRNKERIAAEVKKNLQETMEQYGFGIIGALVNDIEPDAKVRGGGVHDGGGLPGDGLPVGVDDLGGELDGVGQGVARRQSGLHCQLAFIAERRRRVGHALRLPIGLLCRPAKRVAGPALGPEPGGGRAQVPVAGGAAHRGAARPHVHHYRSVRVRRARRSEIGAARTPPSDRPKRG